MKTLKKGITPEQLQRKYLRFLHGSGEAENLQKLLRAENLETQTGLVLRDDLTAKEQKQLKKLLKLIKKNKKSVKSIRLIGLAAVAAAFLLFNFFFKNKLVEREIERGISKLTGAPAECDEAYLKFRGVIGFTHLAVANPDDLRFNLFELGSTEIDVSIWNLLQGRLIINDIRGEQLQWNTPRADAEQIVKTSSQSESEKNRVKSSSPDIAGELQSAGINPERLFEQAQEQFPSLKAASLIKDQLSGSEPWGKKIESYQERVRELIQTVEGFNSESITVKNAPALIQKGQALLPETNNLIQNIEDDVLLLDKQIRETSAAVNQIQGNFENDLQTFRAQITEGRILGTPVSEFMHQYVRRKLKDISGFNVNTKSILERLRETGGRRKKETSLRDKGRLQDERRKGRNYYFPGKYPTFLIRRILFSVGTEDAPVFTRFEIRNISNDADVLGYPIAAQYLGLNNGVRTEARVLAETRSLVKPVEDCQSLFVNVCSGLQKSFAELEISGQPFLLSGDVFSETPVSYIQSYKAEMQNQLRLEQDKRGSFSANGFLKTTLTNPDIQNAPNLNLPQKMLVSLLRTNDVSIESRFKLNESGDIESLTISSNIEEVLRRELQKFQEEGVRAAAAEVEQRLRKELGLSLTPLQAELNRLKEYQDILKSQKTQTAVQQKLISELETRVKDETLKKAGENAKKLLPNLKLP